MDSHDFYLVYLQNKDILDDEYIYKYILDIEIKNEANGFKGINIIDKVTINNDFLSAIYNFLIFIPNDTSDKIQTKSKYGLNYYGITILKDSQKVYNIFSSIYNIFKDTEDFMYMCVNGNTQLLTTENYNYIVNNNFDRKENYEKIYRNDILHILSKMKEFSLKIKDDNLYIIHLGI